MLIGEYFSKITLKNRLSVPKKFRQEIGNRIIMAKWYENCLVIVPETGWKELLQKLTGRMNTLIKAVRDTDRFILGSAYELDLDSQGRFVIPGNLKEYANLDENVVFLGLGDRIEVWNEKIWSEKEKLVQESAAEMLESMTESGTGNE
jgi:MraZ protein